MDTPLDVEDRSEFKRSLSVREERADVPILIRALIPVLPRIDQICLFVLPLHPD